MATTQAARPPAGAARSTLAAVAGLRVPAEINGTDKRSTVLAWVVTRALSLALLLWTDDSVTGDVEYYARSLDSFLHGGTVSTTLQEYPLPALALLIPQYFAAFTNALVFAVLFAATMLAADALFLALLWRVGGERRTDAVNFWLWFVPVVGPLAYFRFDLVPAVLAGAALLAAVRRPAVSGALVAAGAALKLWPAILLPILLIRRVDRQLVLAGFTAVGVLAAGATLAIGGMERVLSPLRWQSERGLQIESVAATPLMLARGVDSERWDVHISPFKAFEIFGPGVGLFITVSTLLTAAGLLVLVALWLRSCRSPAVSIETIGWLMMATATIMTITNKTLSPQYVLWLGGPMCALMVITPRDPAVRRAAAGLMVIALLTHLVFPVWYGTLVGTHFTMPLVAVLLAVRNVLLLWLTCVACSQAWRRTTRKAAEPVAAL